MLGPMARPKLDFVLSTEQRSELQRLVKAPGTPKKTVRRAWVALLAADGKDNDEIAAQLGTSRVTVGLWRQRVLDLGLAGLVESPRPGRPVEVEGTRVRKVLAEVVRPPKGRARWSCRSMARHSGLSSSTVQRLWAANDLKPHRTRTFKLSNDAQFETKFWDIIGLYLDPPVRAVVLCSLDPLIALVGGSERMPKVFFRIWHCSRKWRFSRWAASNCPCRSATEPGLAAATLPAATSGTSVRQA